MLQKSLFAISTMTAAFAASPAIGIATASGHFSVASSEVWGNTTLFDGTTVQTNTASSELALQNGVKVQLGAASKARVWENRLVLEKGVGQLTAPRNFEIDAAGLKISGARLRVAMSDRIEVVAVTGVARVTNGSGLFLAAIPAGRSMSFAMQAGTSGVVTRTGCLLYKDGHYILQDENTQEVAELAGSNLAQNTGNRVEVTATASSARPAVTIATSVLNVTAVNTKSQGGCLSVASALDAKTDAPAGAEAETTPNTPANTPSTIPPRPAGGGGGLSTGAKIGIIAAVAGGGAGAAIALANKKGSTSP